MTGALIPISINHPVTYERPRAYLGGVKAATQEYWPPATGYMEHISAMGIATARVRSETPIKLNTITGGPPELTPTIKTPLRAVHLKESSVMPLCFNSCFRAVLTMSQH
jgi:hypothetical protein